MIGELRVFELAANGIMLIFAIFVIYRLLKIRKDLLIIANLLENNYKGALQAQRTVTNANAMAIRYKQTIAYITKVWRDNCKCGTFPGTIKLHNMFKYNVPNVKETNKDTLA